jgi:hypothetical protein
MILLLARLSRFYVPIVSVLVLVFISLTAVGIFQRYLISYQSPSFGLVRVENRMGGLRIFRDPTSMRSGGWRFASLTPVPLGRASETQFLGFGWRRIISGSPPGVAWRMNLPHWLFIATSCGLIVRPVLRERRLRRESLRGCCTRCGYDLRATPDHCPECGWTMATHAGQSATLEALRPQ